MTPKEKYQDIDLSKLPEKAVEQLEKVKPFLFEAKYESEENKEVKAKGEQALEKLYTLISEKYPESIKSKQAKAPEPKTPQAIAKKVAKQSIKQPAKGKSTASAKPTKRGEISRLAKEIRKDGERFQDAMKRAGEMIQAEKKKASDKQSKQLNTFLKKNQIPAGSTTISRDAPRKALPAGKRTSKSGNTYYEYRQNRTDKSRKRYPYLALGGKLHGAGIFDKGGVLQIDGFNKNIMGTLSFNLKLPNMRKTQDFSVYPVAEKSDYITIQSGTRIGKIEMSTGRGLMSQSYPNGANFVHFQIDMINRKLVKFQLDDEQLKSLKKELAKTAGKSVGRSIITTDNSYADKFAKGGKVSSKFQEIEDIGDTQFYSRYFGKVYTYDKKDKEVAVNLLVVATISDLEDAVPQEDLPAEGNFELTFTLVPESKFMSKELLEDANSENSSVGENDIVNIVNYMGGLRFEPADKIFFKTQEAAEKFLMSKELNDQITGMGFMSGFAMDKAYNRIGQSNWERLEYMMGVTDKFAKGGETSLSDLERTVVYDNNGKTFDRYAIFTPDGSVYAMSENALGFNLYIGDKTEIPKGKHLGKRLSAVPENIKAAVLERLNQDTFAKGGSIGKFKIQLDSWYADVFEDDYEHGESTVSVNSFNSIENKPFNSAKDFFEYLNRRVFYTDLSPEDFVVMEAGRLSTSVLCDENNYPASESEIESWKRGEQKLYSVNYDIFISFVDKKTPTEDELSTVLGVAKYKKGGKIGDTASVRSWYMKTYPTDDMGADINKARTFKSLWAAMHKGIDIYDYLGVGDSIIRERVFEQLAELYGVSYDEVYDLWGESQKRYAEGGELDMDKYNGAGMFAKGGEVKPIDTNFDGIEFSKTYIYKGYYGWIAETFTKDKINGYDWKITTLKRYSGNLLSDAIAGTYMPSTGGGFSGFSYAPFQDPSVTLEQARPKMVTEKAVREQHIAALKKFAEMANAGQLGGQYAKGGGVGDNTGSGITNEHLIGRRTQFKAFVDEEKRSQAISKIKILFPDAYITDDVYYDELRNQNELEINIIPNFQSTLILKATNDKLENLKSIGVIRSFTTSFRQYAKGGYITPDEYREKLENMTDEELIEEIRYEEGIDVDSEELENERSTYIDELVFKYRQVMGSRGYRYDTGGSIDEMKKLWFVTDNRGAVKNISTSIEAAEVFLASALKYDGVINYVKVPLKEWESEKVNVGNIRGYASSFWKSYAKGGGVGKGYKVFNYTDNIFASSEIFSNKTKANEFIKGFRKRFEAQGYYTDNRWNKIDPKEIDLLAIPSDFNPYQKMSKGGSISKSTTYIPNRNIVSLKAKLENRSVNLKGSDLIDGVYAKNNQQFAKGGELNNLMPHSKTHKTHEK